MRVEFVHTTKKIHFAYQELLNHPPDGIKFVNKEEYLTDYESINYKERTLLAKLKSLLGHVPIPTYKHTEHNADLIYASQLLPLTDTPWICDLEHPSALTRFHQEALENPIAKRLIRRAILSKQCRAVTTWTERAKESLLHIFPEFASKAHVVRPSITPLEVMEDHDPNHLLFVGLIFERKGGREALEAFRIIRKENPKAHLTMITKLPDEYRSLANQEGVTIIDKVDRKTLYKDYFAKAGIFFLPTLQDTYGLVFLEAMSCGLPVVTLDDFSTPELIENKKTGIVVKGYETKWFDEHGRKVCKNIHEVIEKHSDAERKRVVQNLASKVLELMRNSRKAKMMGDAARKRVREGDLSIIERDKLLENYFLATK